MFSNYTTFIIGAGASHELGLPLGSGLLANIANLLDITLPNGLDQQTGDSQIARILRAHAIKRKVSFDFLLKKCQFIRRAIPGAMSIDSLISVHATDKDIPFIAKLAIAKAILNAESESRLFEK